ASHGFRNDGTERDFSLSDLIYRTVPWLAPDQYSNHEPGRIQMAMRSAATSATLLGFESPLTEGRSVVALSGSDAEGLRGAAQLLADAHADTLSRIQGSLVVVRGDQVDSLAAERTYYV